MDLLRDTKAGFAVREPLDRQYLFLPQSVQDSFGPAYLVDLTATVNELFPQPGGYPSLLVITPAVIAIVAVAKLDLSGLKTLWVGLGAVGGMYWLSQLARDPGKALEGKLWKI